MQNDMAQATVESYNTYYPFGMLMPGTNRNYSSTNYRYGFQGQEQENDIKGNGNLVDYKYRMDDVRIGRFFSVDPLTAKYPFYSPYSFSGNRVIDMFELEGLEPASPKNKNIEGQTGEGYEEGNAFSGSRNWYWHTGSENIVSNSNGTTETGGYKAGWYSADKYFSLTKDIARGNFSLSEGTSFADGYDELALSAYIDSYKGSEYWTNPATGNLENNPFVNPGLREENLFFNLLTLGTLTEWKVLTNSLLNKIARLSTEKTLRGLGFQKIELSILDDALQIEGLYYFRHTNRNNLGYVGQSFSIGDRLVCHNLEGNIGGNIWYLPMLRSTKTQREIAESISLMRLNKFDSRLYLKGGKMANIRWPVSVARNAKKKYGINYNLLH